MTMSSLSALGLGMASAPVFQDLQLDLDRPDVAISQLKAIRNSVIGSRTKKSNLVNTAIIEQLVQLLKIDLLSSIHAAEMVALSATIIASLANTPAHHTLLQLMRYGTQDALLVALRTLVDRLHQSQHHLLAPHGLAFDALRVLECLLRALRSVLLSVADQLSASPRWGIGSSWGTKCVSSGVAVTRHTSATGATKIFGKSNRSTTASPVPIQDVIMRSASTQSLRTSAQADSAHIEEQERRELRLLSRLFLTKVYSPQNISLLLGSLFMCNVPEQADVGNRPARNTSLRSSRLDSRGTSTMGTPSPALRPADAGTTQPVSMRYATSAVIDPIDGESLSMTTKTKVLGMIEMVCTILSGTAFIPGCSAQTDAGTAPAEDLARRRARILDFAAIDSPFASEFVRSAGGSTALAEEESRGRKESDRLSRKASGIEADLIRKGSRSRSRLKDPAQGTESSHLPVWEEDEESCIPTASDGGQSDTVLVVLLAAAECGFVKTQEAALFCLAELTRDNTDTSLRLFRCHPPSGMLPTSMLLGLRRSPSANVRLAAFCCLANIIKVHPFTSKTNQCVLEVLIELLDHVPAANVSATSGAGNSHFRSQTQVEMQIQAAFAIARLVADNVDLQILACESYNALFKIATLLEKACNRSQPQPKAAAEPSLSSALGSGAILSPFKDPTVGMAPATVDESSIRLREACLTALSSLVFQQDELRRNLLDAVQPSVLTLVVSSLTFPALGIRVAACRLTRALSRSVSILRTSIVDAGVAQKLIALLNDVQEEEAVKIEASAALCNLVLDFSPMKKLAQELGGIDKLVQLARDGADESEAQPRDDAGYSTLPTPAYTGSSGMDRSTRHLSAQLSGSQQLRFHALWALKNLLSHAEYSIKEDVMSKLSFSFLQHICETGTMVFREQALNILRNLASTKDTDVTFMVDGIGGGERLMTLLENCIWEGRGAGEPGAAVIEQAAFVLVNVATGTEPHRRLILRSPNILDAIYFFCNHPWKDIRVAAARCIGNLLVRSKSSTSQPLAAALSGSGADSSATEGNSATTEPYSDTFWEAKARFTAFGIDAKLRDLAQNDVELDVRERARSALHKLEAET